jgi:hypothetical protein
MGAQGGTGRPNTPRRSARDADCTRQSAVRTQWPCTTCTPCPNLNSLDRLVGFGDTAPTASGLVGASPVARVCRHARVATARCPHAPSCSATT